MIVQTIHVFLEKPLIQPERPKNFGGNFEFFRNFPEDGLLCRLPQFHPPSGQVEIGGTLIPHSQNLSIMQENGSHSVIELFISGLIGNIHAFTSQNRSQKKPRAAGQTMRRTKCLRLRRKPWRRRSSLLLNNKLGRGVKKKTRISACLFLWWTCLLYTSRCV